MLAIYIKEKLQFALILFSVVNNCLDAFPTSGIVKIFNHGLDPFPVYCDQKNDEGGDYCCCCFFLGFASFHFFFQMVKMKGMEEKLEGHNFVTIYIISSY